jgi:hypothetical protein
MDEAPSEAEVAAFDGFLQYQTLDVGLLITPERPLFS